MRSDLLLRLADYLEKDANNEKGVKFSLIGWGSIIERPADGQDHLSCGTVACAMGIARAADLFVNEGMRPFDQTETWAPFSPSLIDPSTGRRYEMWQAIKVLFGIEDKESEWLFSADCYKPCLRTGKEAELAVAARIRSLADGDAKVPDYEHLYVHHD